MKLLIPIYVIILMYLAASAQMVHADTTEPANQAAEPSDKMTEAVKQMDNLTEQLKSERLRVERERLEYNRVQNARLRRERLEQDEKDRIEIERLQENKTESERLQNEPAKREMKEVKRVKTKKKPVKEKSKDDEIAIKSTTLERYLAMDMAVMYVKRRLKAPSTAKFPSQYDMAAERNSKNIWSVTGYVDSQNSFGAMLRSNFYVKMKQEGDRWFPIKVQVQ